MFPRIPWPRVPLSPKLTALLAVCALFAAASRGLDYVLVSDTSKDLSVVEHAAPMDVWGMILICAAICAAAGWAARFWPGVILAHAALAGAYFALGAGALWAAGINWVGSGWRTGIGFICLQGVVHVALSAAAWGEWDRDRG